MNCLGYKSNCVVIRATMNYAKRLEAISKHSSSVWCLVPFYVITHWIPNIRRFIHSNVLLFFFVFMFACGLRWIAYGLMWATPKSMNRTHFDARLYSMVLQDAHTSQLFDSIWMKCDWWWINRIFKTNYYSNEMNTAHVNGIHVFVVSNLKEIHTQYWLQISLFLLFPFKFHFDEIQLTHGPHNNRKTSKSRRSPHEQWTLVLLSG